MLEWLPVANSSRVTAIAYRASTQQILVRFQDGAEWCYEECPLHTWRAFSSLATSKGKFIASVLDRLPNHAARRSEGVQRRRLAGDRFCVWQMRCGRIVGNHPRPTLVNAFVQVSPTMPAMTIDSH